MPEHLPSLMLAPTLAPLVEAIGDPIAGLRAIADAGFRAVQFSASIPSMRARELDRSARRDVVARLRRLELTLTGIDLWIPPEHYLSTQHVDRATSALFETIELAADLGRVAISIELPDDIEPGFRAALVDRAHTCGVLIADFSRFEIDRLGAGEVLGIGIDPAAEISAGRNPVEVVAQRDRITAARFSDADSAGRIAPGRGRLDVLAYQAALITGGFHDAVALDLRRIQQPVEAMTFARHAWLKHESSDHWM